MKRILNTLREKKWVVPALLILFVPALVFFGVGVYLSGFPVAALRASARWLDPMFFLYNFVLAMLAILMLPGITSLYVTRMKKEKRRRLTREIPPDDMKLYGSDVHELMERQFSLREYLAPLITTMIVVGAGVFIILLLKPCFPAQAAGAPAANSASQETCQGVDYGKGANVLLLGPFVEKYGPDRTGYYHQIAISLAAFQFGFLGAYVYFLGSLTRAFFILDLSSDTFVGGSVRMVTSSLLALVISFAIPSLAFFANAENVASSERFLRLLPFLSFFIGFFPDRGLLWMEDTASRMFGMKQPEQTETPMSRLTGMSLAHQVRLAREGYDNYENLSHARPVELAVRTGFSYRQLKHWVGEAWLRVHMAPDYETFANLTGIATMDELENCWNDPKSPVQTALGAGLLAKTTIVALLIQTRPRSVPVPTAPA